MKLRVIVTSIFQGTCGIRTILVLSAIIALAIPIVCFTSFKIYQAFATYPPGFRDYFDSQDWNRDNIGHFLNNSLPEDAEMLLIDGCQGLVGSYGVYPTLRFTIAAAPESTLQFARQFCNGIMHAGYDPFQSVESSSPSADSILIRVNGSIHYSRSHGVPETILGNRCERFDNRERERGIYWVEEIRIDTSNPDQYTLTYDLPYGPNAGRNTEEFYTRAGFIAPFGRDPDIRFRFYVTGFRNDTPDAEQPTYVLDYHTVCIETADLALFFDFLGDDMQQYASSYVRIFVDGIERPSAEISEFGFLRPAGMTAKFGKWDYCLEANWDVGRHTMQVFVIPPQVSNHLELSWDFEVHG